MPFDERGYGYLEHEGMHDLVHREPVKTLSERPMTVQWTDTSGKAHSVQSDDDEMIAVLNFGLMAKYLQGQLTEWKVIH